jgi:hypothetical protein
MKQQKADALLKEANEYKSIETITQAHYSSRSNESS